MTSWCQPKKLAARFILLRIEYWLRSALPLLLCCSSVISTRTVPVVPVRDLNFVKYFAGRRDYVLYPGP
jgi:hypothetical protein